MAYEDKVALITGALGGIGQEFVRVLLERKAKVALVDIAKDGGEIVQTFIEKYGRSHVTYIQADVANPTQLEDAFVKTIGIFQNLDIVVNNAGIGDENNPYKIASVNFTGTLVGTALAFEKYLPKHRSGEEGVVINTASLSGLIAFPGAPLYAATKFGIVGLGRSYGHAHHYETTKVRILTICPGFTRTEMINTDNIPHSVPERYGKLAKYIMDNRPNQDVEEVGKMFLRAYEEGATGSVWVINDGKGGEVEFPMFQVKSQSSL